MKKKRKRKTSVRGMNVIIIFEKKTALCKPNCFAISVHSCDEITRSSTSLTLLTAQTFLICKSQENFLAQFAEVFFSTP